MSHFYRFRNVKEEEDENKCHVCNNDDIETEFHFLCVCNAHIEFRNILYNNIYNVYHNFYSITDKDKFVYLMEFHWKELSVYLEKAWEKRTNILYKQT